MHTMYMSGYSDSSKVHHRGRVKTRVRVRVRAVIVYFRRSFNSEKHRTPPPPRTTTATYGISITGVHDFPRGSKWPPRGITYDRNVCGWVTCVNLPVAEMLLLTLANTS